MTMAKKRVVSKATREKLSASWAAKRAAKESGAGHSPADPPKHITLAPAPRFLNLDESTVDSLCRQVSRAVSHLLDYKLKMEREGFEGIPFEIEMTIGRLNDLKGYFGR